MKHFGIIGKPLHHSFSANFFNEKFTREGIDAEYTLYPLEDIADVQELFRKVPFTGMNVTMPYKQAVIPYLDGLDDTAAQIGAVNVIHFQQDGRKIGYNSDAIGFIRSIEPLLLPTDKKALVLGTGGAAKAVRYGLEKLGLQVTNVSRTPQAGQLSYAMLQDSETNELADYQVIVNCTPLGMTPNVDALADIPYDQLTSAHLLYDCIYNPEMTRFLMEGQVRGCRIKNGMDMLFGQAHAAWEVWNK